MRKLDVVGDTNIKLVLVNDWTRGVRHLDFCWEQLGGRWCCLTVQGT